MKRHEIDKLIARIAALESEVAILRARPIVVMQPQPLPAPMPHPLIPPWGPMTSQTLAACTVKSGPAPMAWN